MRNINSGCRTKSTQAGNKKVLTAVKVNLKGSTTIASVYHNDKNNQDAFNY